jgi:hypothetical protein
MIPLYKAYDKKLVSVMIPFIVWKAISAYCTNKGIKKNQLIIRLIAKYLYDETRAEDLKPFFE